MTSTAVLVTDSSQFMMLQELQVNSDGGVTRSKPSRNSISSVTYLVWVVSDQQLYTSHIGGVTFDEREEEREGVQQFTSIEAHSSDYNANDHTFSTPIQQALVYMSNSMYIDCGTKSSHHCIVYT